MTPAQVSDIVINLTSFNPQSVPWTALAGRVLGCGCALRTMGDRGIEVRADAIMLVRDAINDDRVTVRGAGFK
jgi:hypothetical protein